MNHSDVLAELLDYVRTKFLDGDPQGELDAKTPLLQWGILTSMNTAVLLSHIHEHWGVDIPPARLNGAGFKNLNSISALIVEVARAA